jgi:hypothetical protein
MKTRQGYVQGYNSRAAVSKDQIIPAAEVTQEENDLYQLEPMIQETKATISEAGIDDPIETSTADTGYWRDEFGVEAIEREGVKLHIAVQKDCKQRSQCNDPQGRIPAGATRREPMGRRLRTKKGKAAYKLRSQTVEPVFGQIKAVLGLRGFLRRGIEAVRREWKLICACHTDETLQGLWDRLRQLRGGYALIGPQFRIRRTRLPGSRDLDVFSTAELPVCQNHVSWPAEVPQAALCLIPFELHYYSMPLRSVLPLQFLIAHPNDEISFFIRL